jgi:hypothetical protein
MEIIEQNGGQYSATLTKKCTHLVANISFWYFRPLILSNYFYWLLLFLIVSGIDLEIPFCY